MIEDIRQSVISHWEHIPSMQRASREADLSITKFVQPLVWADRKVLFLVTYKGELVCVIKTVRYSRYNEKLQHEKLLQEMHDTYVAKVYFDDTLGGRYLYAEEVLEGRTLTRRKARRMEQDVVKLVTAFPVSGAIHSEELADVCASFISLDDNRGMYLSDMLRKQDTLFRCGRTHNDLGRTNILEIKGALRIIDWERADERPLWLIDAVYFMIRVRDIGTFEEWQQKASSAFVEYTGVTQRYGEALYFAYSLLTHLENMYPELYIKVSQILRKKLQ